jgi:GT2 family glycosyltransferase
MSGRIAAVYFAMHESLPVSIVIPTIGRLERLRACLESISRCSERAGEVLVIDQSEGDKVPALVRDFAPIGARAVRCEGRGVSVGMNQGLREAEHDVVLVTHDDCTVDVSWVGAAARLMASDPEMIVTGRVLPGGDDPLGVASTKDGTTPEDFTGQVHSGALYPNNMALNRSVVLAFGGFDERFSTAAEDNDLSYRWLRSGRRLRYEPELVVWHHDWRSHEELERLYVEYWRWQGAFYAKHLRRGDLTMLRFIARDLYFGARAVAARVLRGRPRWSDWRRGLLRGLPVGLAQGWRLFRPQKPGAPARGARSERCPR